MAIHKTRVKYHFVPVTSKSGLLISVRRFRASPVRRSASYKQLVVRTYFLPAKEVALRRVNRQAARQLIGSRQGWLRGSLWPKARTAALLSVITVALAGVIYFGVQLKKPSRIDLTGNRPPSQIVEPQSEAAAASPTLPRSEPVRLQIGVIGVDANITEVGLMPDKTVEVPEDWLVAGWYKYSPTPGEIGPSVIVGHVDNTKGLGVFWRLRELSAGDEVSVTRADKSTAKFKVTKIVQYPRDNFPTQEVYGPINYAGLRLITCGGSFDRSIREYDKNTVVFATLVN